MYSVKVKDIMPMEDMRLLVFFEDGKIKLFDVKALIPAYPEFSELRNENAFNLVKVEPGGYGVSWNDYLDCSEGELYKNGIDIPLKEEDFISFANLNLVTTSEATQILKCTRQNIEDLIKRGKLHPVRSFKHGKMFRRSEVEQRIWSMLNE